MEEIITISKAIEGYGILAILAGVLIWTIVVDKKNNAKISESLTLLSKAIDNMANLIDLQRQSNDNMVCLLGKHDERSIKIKEEMTEVKAMVSSCTKRK